MRRGSRLLRASKRAGVLVCGLLLLSMSASFFVTVGFFFEGGTSYLELTRGCIYYEDFTLYAGMDWPAGWFVHRTGDDSRLPIVFPSWRSSSDFAVPLWIVILLGGAVTGLLFSLDRRHRPAGHCPCGYDLTGNESGVCPECGVEVQV